MALATFCVVVAAALAVPIVTGLESPMVPREMVVPCYTVDRSMFMWTDFQCHYLSECGSAGVDMARMVDYNEKNVLVPAQPCRCLQSKRRVASVDPELLPDNCGGCAPYSPVDERPPAFSAPELAEATRCALVPRGNPEAESDSALWREEADATLLEGDFFCLASSPTCRAEYPVTNVDSIWKGAVEYTTVGRGTEHLASFFATSESQSPASSGVLPLEMCGPQVDYAATLETSHCECVRNTWNPSSSWGVHDFTAWIDEWDSSATFTRCDRCANGYTEVWDDWHNVCHRDRFQCATDWPGAPMLLTSTLSPEDLDMSPGTHLYRCINPDDFCSPGATYARHDADESANAKACVCTYTGFGKAWINPAWPELGPQTSCVVCDNANGYFGFYWGNCISIDAILASTSTTNPVPTLATYRIENIRKFVFEAWDVAWTPDAGGDPTRWPYGIDWPGDPISIHGRIGIRDLWWPYPIPNTVWRTEFLPEDAYAGGSDSATWGPWFKALLTAARPVDAPQQNRDLFTWWVCGQAAAPQVPGEPLQCVCIDNAAHRPVTRAHPTRSTSVLLDDCFCNDGYAFDRYARECKPHAEVCGGAAFKDITYTCVCLVEAEKDEAGRCTVCKDTRFRPLDGCPYIKDWCSIPDLVGVDVDVTQSSTTCTCDAAKGIRPFQDQRGGGVAGCYTCSAAGHTRDPATGECRPTAEVCPDPTERLDADATETTGVCACRGGWAYTNTVEGCTTRPAQSWVDTSDAVHLWTSCGAGVDGPATEAANHCVCDGSAHWDMPTDANIGCNQCATNFILVRVGTSTNATAECLDAVNACGTGVDVVATHATLSCACTSHFKAFADQPTGKCEDCASGFLRRAVAPAVCLPPPATDRLYGATTLDTDAYARLLDWSFQDGATVFNDDALWTCGARWTQQHHVWTPHHILQLPSSSTHLLKSTVTTLAEARVSCHAYFPCNGFIAFEAYEQQGVSVYYVLYTTLYTAHATADSRSVVYTPETAAYATMVYAETWDLTRVDNRLCVDPSVDPAWYWTTWNDRLVDEGLDPIAFSVAGLAAWDGAPTVRLAMDEPRSVMEHFYWRGHLLRLWPNAGCKLGPLPADVRSGCRAPTCPVFSTCPFTFPVDTGDAHLCLKEGSAPAPTGRVDVASIVATWANSTNMDGDLVSAHPAPCRQGMCLFDLTSATAATTVRTACSCPGTGLHNAPGHACDSTVNTLRDEGSGVCRFPLLTGQEQSDCGIPLKDGQDVPVCGPGRMGPECSLYDVDFVCHAPGTTGMCSGHGTCALRDAPLQPMCSCTDGWTGTYCEHRTCENGCGALGACVAITTHEETSAACLCALHATTGAPLAAKDPVTGLCTIDLCNDHLSTERRYGAFVRTPGATSLDGAPLGTCACTANALGIQNGGDLCDEPACAASCGLAQGAQQPGYADVCVRCEDVPDAPQCDTGLLGIGAICDCEGAARGGALYWATNPWRFVTAKTSTTILGLTYERCTPYCNGRGDWDALGQRCLCTDDAWRGDRCDEPSCPNGVYQRATDDCVACKPQFVRQVVDGRRQCQQCQVGYTGDDCSTCEPGFVRTDTAHGALCEICEDAITARCSTHGTASSACTLTSVTCTCRPGYKGADCGVCEWPAWKVTASHVAHEQVNATFAAGQCVPVSAWQGCSPTHTAFITLQVGSSTATPQCLCKEPYSATPGLSVGDPGDCSLCEPGYQQHPETDACIPCATALACDASGTLRAECPNPGELLPQRGNDEANVCVCDLDGGRAGAQCHECNTETKWVPVPNTSPLLCHHCDRDCGAHGEVMCGISSTTCSCRGAWTGANCDKCMFCGQGGTCLPAENTGDEWCACLTAQGYAKDERLVGTPGAYRAACTSCHPGFFMHGIRCMAIAEVCGPGADADATRDAGKCVCGPTYLDLAHQASNSCTTCISTHIPGANGTCGTCDPVCGANALCAWNDANGRHGCECATGFAEHQGGCTICAEGHFGPQCTPCPTACPSSGGTCVWNGVSHSIDCDCPSGTTRVRPGAPDSPCRPCTEGVESGPRCTPILTCPANAHSVAAPGASNATCECLDGYERAFDGGNPLLTPCATPEAIQAWIQPPEGDTNNALFAQFDLAALATITGGAAILIMTGVVCMGCIIHCVDKRHAHARAPTPGAGYAPPPRTPPAAIAPTSAPGAPVKSAAHLQHMQRGWGRGGGNVRVFHRSARRRL